MFRFVNALCSARMYISWHVGPRGLTDLLAAREQNQQEQRFFPLANLILRSRRNLLLRVSENLLHGIAASIHASGECALESVQSFLVRQQLLFVLLLQFRLGLSGSSLLCLSICRTLCRPTTHRPGNGTSAGAFAGTACNRADRRPSGGAASCPRDPCSFHLVRVLSGLLLGRLHLLCAWSGRSRLLGI
jgi:hypothetical protein